MYRDPIGAHRHAGIPISNRTWRDEVVEDDDVSGMLFQDCVFERVRLVRTNFSNCVFLNARFDDCAFEDCVLNQTVMTNCRGERIWIGGGHLVATAMAQMDLNKLQVEQAGERLVLAESKFKHVAFDGAGRAQRDLTVSGCEIGEVLAENVAWRGASIVKGELSAWSLARAEMTNCNFIRSIANGVDLSEVRFESCNLYQSALEEARLNFAERSIFAECELPKADLSEAKLNGALFSKANAAGANFERADLTGAMFPDAKLAGACFAGAAARNSVWLRADLTDADFTGVDAWRGSFRNAVFKGAAVTDASFVEADLHGVEETLNDADLRESRGTVAWRAEREAETDPARR